MRKDQYSGFQEIMKRAALLTYKPKDTDFKDLVLALFEELAPRYALSQVDAAVRRHVQLEKFFPVLSDIIRHIDGTPEDRAVLAWVNVIKAVRYIGQYNSVAFPFPEYNFAISQMGEWIGFCSSLREDELKWSKRDFERFYVLGDQRVSWHNEADKIRVPRYCVGSFELNSRALGYALPDVIDAETRQPIAGFRDNLPALNSGDGANKKVIAMIGALAGNKRAAL